jgi:hypothetical protein
MIANNALTGTHYSLVHSLQVHRLRLALKSGLEPLPVVKLDLLIACFWPISSVNKQIKTDP